MRMKKRLPTKQQIKLWNRLVKEVFEHPKSEYSIFVYELVKRRVLRRKFTNLCTASVSKKF